MHLQYFLRWRLWIIHIRFIQEIALKSAVWKGAALGALLEDSREKLFGSDWAEILFSYR